MKIADIMEKWRPMKISELINRLLEIYGTHGDMNVYSKKQFAQSVGDNCSIFDIENKDIICIANDNSGTYKDGVYICS